MWIERVDHAICWPDSDKAVAQINRQHSTSDWFTLNSFASFWKVMCLRPLKRFKLWCFRNGCFKTWCSRANSVDLSSKKGFSNCWKWWCHGQCLLWKKDAWTSGQKNWTLMNIMQFENLNFNFQVVSLTPMELKWHSTIGTAIKNANSWRR